jgi:hypothetical protein
MIGALTAIVLAALFGVVACSDDKSSAGPLPDADAWTFEKVSGDGQSTPAYDTLDNRLVVALRDGRKKALYNHQIRFSLVAGSGEVFARPAGGLAPLEVNMPTDWQGQAAANFRNFGGGPATVKAQVTERPELTVTFTIHVQ